MHDACLDRVVRGDSGALETRIRLQGMEVPC